MKTQADEHIFIDQDSDLTLSPKAKLSLTKNASKVLQARYLKKDEHGNVDELPEAMFARVAATIASAETVFESSSDLASFWEREYYNIMVKGEFLPNSPTLMNAGRSMGMLSACFVLPVLDSIDEIFDSIKFTAQIQKAGGGTGFDFSSLRPAGDIVRSSGGQTSGPLSFLKVFSEATNAIQQGAFRRGANMGMMRIDHPDIVEFIRVKEDLSQLTNYNLSVSVPDDFMEAVKNNPEQIHRVINPRTGEGKPLAKKDKPDEFWAVGELFDMIVDKAWKNGEPGIIFIDEINRHNPTPHIGTMQATNPCGEQPLLPFEACNLGSINLAKFVNTVAVPDGIDWNAMRDCIRTSVRFLDNVVEVNRYPLPQIEDMCRGNRKIGLGVMGFADALYKLRVPYNSQDGVELGYQFMEFLQTESHRASEQLADERGCFPNWTGSRWDTEDHRHMRNACVTTVAPTGTISILANCSGGIEPLFSVAFQRNVLNGQQLTEVNDEFLAAAKDAGVYSDAMIEQAAAEGSLHNIENLPDDLKRTFVCAHDIAPEWHVRMQAAFQANCDAAISKTTNFPHDCSQDDVKTIYHLAYDMKCKGVTVYRDGCRNAQPMSRTETKAEEETITVDQTPQTLKPIKLPEIMSGVRIRQASPFGNMHVKIVVDPVTSTEREVFAQLGKGGDVANSDLEAICRLISLFLRCHGTLDLVIDQLENIGSSLSIPSKDGRILSLGDGLATCLKKYLAAKEKYGLEAMLLGKIDPNAEPREKTETTNFPVFDKSRLNSFKVKCPECQDTLHFEEGCVKCQSCGYSQC